MLGTRQRAVPAVGPYDHKTGTGYVKAHRGDYADAICNRKARVKLLCHEIFGGMSSYAARHLRRLARDAARGGADATDYTLSATARSFVPFYAQRISSNIVMHGARNALDRIKRLRHVRHGARRRRRRVSLRGRGAVGGPSSLATLRCAPAARSELSVVCARLV